MVRAQADATPPLKLRLDESMAPPATGSDATPRPMVLRANELRSRPDLDTVAEGDVEMRQAGTVIRADRLSYDNADDTVLARGKVRIERQGSIYRGPELKLQLRTFEGYFLAPEFEFERLGTGGRAERVDFLDSSRLLAHHTRYSSCPRDGSGDPDWLLAAERVKMDVQANEGIAEGAQLRFLGVPILALPVLSFPLTDDRKSGWLPPTIYLDSKSGIELGMPYYWNIAPQRDATLTPLLLARRGLGLDAEFRYLQPGYAGQLDMTTLPNDRLAGQSRGSWRVQHDGRLPFGLRYGLDAQRVSDDGYWKDFPRQSTERTPRLLPLDLKAEQPFGWLGDEAESALYGRVQRWQVLQSGDAATAIQAPYDRAVQLGLRTQGGWPLGLRYGLVTEANRFTRPDDDPPGARPTGWRWHAQASLSRPWETPGWWVRPKLSLNTVRYALDAPLADGRSHLSRSVPSASVDTGMVFERASAWGGRAMRQTLEPRLLYVNTPFRDQSALPNFDAAGNDFNMISVFGENAFSGVDRVSDAHQVTAGVSTRLLDERTGAEALRLGIAQRLLLDDQRITPDGTPFTQRVSDVLVEGSSSLWPGWRLDGAMQWGADISRPVRSIAGVRWSPGPFRTLSATYRYARGLSEQMELGWQWPLAGARVAAEGTAPGGGMLRALDSPSGRCSGTLYGVGRVNYSMKDSRITDSLLGLEYDAGCWIARVVAERKSTGRLEATTRLYLQLELVGLSRLGTNPLKTLKDNIPGYQLLRDERDAASSTGTHD